MTHDTEELNNRSLYLRMLKKIWIVPVLGVCLAVVFGLLYTAYITGVSSKRDYLVSSKYYIHFAFNENTQKAYDYYNAYTWEDMIFSSPEISDYIVGSLPEGMTLQEARSYIHADEASDIRLLTVEVRMNDAALAQQMSDGIREGLVSFGNTAEEFEEIEFLSQEGPTLEVVNNRTNNAVLLGAFLGVLLSFLTLLWQETMDDRLYVPEEAAKRYGIPVLGVWSQKEDKEVPAFLVAERLMNLEALRDGTEILLVTSEEMAVAEAAADLLTKENLSAKAVGSVLEEGFAKEMKAAAKTGAHVLLTTSFGKGSGAKNENLLQHLKQMGAPAEGILLVGADGTFLRMYYREA